MGQPKKDAKTISMKLDRNIYTKLDIFCDETGLSKTAATEKILNQYLSEYLDRPEEERKLFK